MDDASPAAWPPASAAPPAQALRRRLVVAVPLVAYAAGLAWLVRSMHGLPATREVLVLLVLGGFLAASLGSTARLRRLALGVAVDWFPFAAMLALYDRIRGLANGHWLPVHSRPQIDADRVIGLGSVPTTWLQRHLWHGAAHLHWWDYLAFFTYSSYFFVPTLVLAVLWWRSRAEFQRLAAMVVLLAFAGCATYVLYPATPPWLASQEGLLPPVHHVIAAVSGRTPFLSFHPLWKKGGAYANLVAAVPSLHAAFTMLVTRFLVARSRSPWRHLLWIYPLVMCFALVYSGEHYVTDVLIGWVYALVVYGAVDRLRYRTNAMRVEPSSGAGTIVNVQLPRVPTGTGTVRLTYGCPAIERVSTSRPSKSTWTTAVAFGRRVSSRLPRVQP